VAFFPVICHWPWSTAFPTCPCMATVGFLHMATVWSLRKAMAILSCGLCMGHKKICVCVCMHVYMRACEVISPVLYVPNLHLWQPTPCYPVQTWIYYHSMFHRTCAARTLFLFDFIFLCSANCCNKVHLPTYRC